MSNPYERLKELTRGRTVDGAAIRQFIESLDLPPQVEQRLSELTPASYIGLASKLVTTYLPAPANPQGLHADPQGPNA